MVKKYHMILVCVAVCVIGSVGRECRGSFGRRRSRLSSEERAHYEQTLQKKSFQELREALFKTTDDPLWCAKKRIILHEIYKRLEETGEDAEPLLTEFIQHLTTMSEPDWDGERVRWRADLIIQRANLRAKGDQEAYLNELEQLLFAPDLFVPEKALSELRKLASPQVRDMVKKYENRNPNIKILRLEIDYGELSDEELVATMFESARQTIVTAEDVERVNLVAEGTLLSRRDNETITQMLLTEMQTTVWMRDEAPARYDRYMNFLKDNHASLKYRQVRSNVGEQAAYQLYSKSLHENWDVYLQHLDRWEHPEKYITPETEKQQSQLRVETVPGETSTPEPSPPPTRTVARGGTITPLEELGEDLSPYPKDELLRRLATSTDKIELRKVAIVLGDRAIAGTLELSDSEWESINTAVLKYIDQSSSKDIDEAGEAEEQIDRLWSLAIPALLRYFEQFELDSEDMNTYPEGALQRFGVVIEHLVTMRNEEIIKVLITHAEETQSDLKRRMVLTILERDMRPDDPPNIPIISKRRSLVLPPEQIQELYQRLIVPALKELQTKE